LKKIVIISYFFPPGKTPGNRALSWFKFFSNFGIYPIILTKAHEDNAGVTKFENGEVHRINSAPIFSENSFSSKLPSIARIVYYKIYSITIWLSKYDKTFQDFNNYFFDKLSNECDYLLITGSPFNLFKIGYNYVNRENGKWIADYRDLWNSSEMPRHFDSFIEKLYRKFIALKIEKKWVNSAFHVTTVSDHLGHKLRMITSNKVSVIENGFFEEEHQNFIRSEKENELTFVYVGTIYKTQQIDLCLNAINDAFERESAKGKFIFIGSSFNRKLKTVIDNWDSPHLEIISYPRLLKRECIKIQSKCHIGIMSSYGVKGIPASKLYEFLGLRQPVLLFPSDNDIIEETLNKANLGYCFSSYDEAVEGIQQIITTFSSEKEIRKTPNVEFINTFSRKNLAKKYLEKVFYLKK
jgi:glycosyltransferase involved in cell wall biosynthesis